MTDTFSFRAIIRDEVKHLVDRIDLLEQRVNTVTMVENPEMEAKLAQVSRAASSLSDPPFLDYVRIGDLRQILAQMLHSDPEAILQAKDTARAMTVLEVIENDMARVSRAMNNPPKENRLAQAINLLIGWVQHHEGSPLVPINATRAFIGKCHDNPEPEEK